MKIILTYEADEPNEVIERLRTLSSQDIVNSLSKVKIVLSKYPKLDYNVVFKPVNIEIKSE